jgi:rfaE bifunctional protein kinase chain/domain
MTPSRFKTITGGYSKLRLAIVGDFCLDRYLEIDPQRREISIETGLPVHNVVNVRAQPGGAGTILNNLIALDVGKLFVVGFCGDDGEGYELRSALATNPSVSLEHFIQTPTRRTFTYCKPLVMAAGKPPRELNRLDSKNWSPTPKPLRERLAEAVRTLAGEVDAFIVLEQVDLAQTGVITSQVLAALHDACQAHPDLLVLADSRRGLQGFPPFIFKMNAAELATLVGTQRKLRPSEVEAAAAKLALKNNQPVFVSLAERGILGALPTGEVHTVPALPVRGPIDIVGAGDAVTANLACALAADANLRESLELANAAASVVIHKLGTTGTASVREIRTALAAARAR